MPADLLARAAVGWVEVHPRFRHRLDPSAGALLDLPGEVVSGHPDRHVVRVELPGWDRPLYLKREHRVGWRARLRQWRDGFGWASRCEREVRLLQSLEAAGLPGPSWVAHGEDGRGRAFLLVEELPGVELRAALSDDRVSPADRSRLAGRLGRAVAGLHAAGFTTPDLSAKHVFVDPVGLIDWQSARRSRRVGGADRLRSLALLHASLADHLGGPRDRLRFLRAYRRAAGVTVRPREVEQLAAKLRGRRSVRDQRQPDAGVSQRLVWLAGEAVCAVPDVAESWPTPAGGPPFYGRPPGAELVHLPDGRAAVLRRGRSIDPVGRLRAWLRGRPWRSPGATLGRVLFHLERYGVPGPKLYAFGQRGADWFVLHEPPAGRPGPAAGTLLDQLHAAGCRPVADGWAWVDDAGRVTVGDPTAVRIVRRLTGRQRRADRRAWA